MRHFTEQEIERILLKGDECLSERTALVAHLLECAGCREMHDELKAFYETLASGDRKLLPENKDIAGLTLSPAFSLSPPHERSGSVRLWVWARESPVLSSFVAGTFIILAALVFVRRSMGDPEILYTMTNDQASQLQVYGSGGKLLWEIPYRRGAGYENRELNSYDRYTAVVDLVETEEGPEVVTMIAPEGPLNESGTVRAYKSGGGLLWKTEVGAGIDIRYNTTRYPAILAPRKVISIDNPETGMVEILACFVNTHSPAAIYRLNSLGEVLGSLWNYGHFADVAPHDVGTDGSIELVVTGYNDEGGGGFISVVDPKAIHGSVASRQSPHYPMEMFTGESRIIQIPLPPWTSTHEGRFTFQGITYRTADEILVSWGGLDPVELIFSISFDSDFDLKTVVPTDSWVEYRRKNKELNLPSEKAIREWFFREIRVWDGMTWRKGTEIPQ